MPTSTAAPTHKEIIEQRKKILKRHKEEMVCEVCKTREHIAMMSLAHSIILCETHAAEFRKRLAGWTLGDAERALLHCKQEHAWGKNTVPREVGEIPEEKILSAAGYAPAKHLCKEQKQELVRRIQSREITPKEAAALYGVHTTTVYACYRQYLAETHEPCVLKRRWAPENTKERIHRERILRLHREGHKVKAIVDKLTNEGVQISITSVRNVLRGN